MSFLDIDTHLRCPRTLGTATGVRRCDWSVDLATMPPRAFISWDGEITMDLIVDRARALLAQHVAEVHS